MSRLLEDSQKIRESLEARNLYTPNDPYQLDNKQLVKSINTLASIIKPAIVPLCEICIPNKLTLSTIPNSLSNCLIGKNL